MPFKQALQALTFAFALVASAPSFAIAPDQPSQVLSMLEVLAPHTGAAASAGVLTKASSLDTLPASSFYMEESRSFSTLLNKEALTLNFWISYDYGTYDFLSFTLDPDREIGSVAIHAPNAAGYPDVQYANTKLSYDNFYTDAKSFSVIDLQRDSSGNVVSFAASFDFWGRYPRDPQTQQLTGRLWYNSNATIPVPEPDSVALLLVGLTIAAALARRQAGKRC